MGWIRERRERERQQKLREHSREVRQAKEIDKMIKKSAEASAAADRILVGERGHWIQSTGVVNAGREQFAVFDPSGMHLTNIWGKDAAEAAVHEHIEKGTISR
jgi:hypothetical protein